MQIANGVEMLEVSANLMGKPDMIYPMLLWEEDTVILVDSGFPGQTDQVRAAMIAAGVPLERITHIILTHHDIDHIGGVSSILKQLPGLVCVMAHETEVDYINGAKTPLKLAAMEANLESLPVEAKTMYETLSRAFHNSRVEVDQTLTDGELLPYCGGMQVIHTPGHTLGHICLYLKESKTLIAGDALGVNDGKLTVSPPQLNHDMALCKKSLQKLAQFDTQAVICYHGGIYQGSAAESIRELANSIPA